MTTPDDARGMEDQNKSLSKNKHKNDNESKSENPIGEPEQEHEAQGGGESQGEDEGRGAGESAGDGWGLADLIDIGDLRDGDRTGETPDEAALRALLRGAVDGIDGSPDALDHLRRAIPARRQHRRQALAGAAAAVLLAGMAVPALIHAADSSGSTDASPANASSTSPAAADGNGQINSWAGGPHSGQAATGTGGTGTKHQSPTNTPPSAYLDPPDTALANAPDCSSVQLGQGSSSAAAPDASGRVYGWFRVANVSGKPCTVTGGGQVQALAAGAADPTKIQVVGHTAGDPAAGLPAGSDGPVVLAPGATYEVQFAFVPSGSGPGGCPVTPTTPPTTPTTAPTDPPTTPADPGPGGADPGATGNSATTQLGSGDPPASTPPASIALNHTPAAGAPVIDGPVIQNACAGTVYTTAAIPDEPAGDSGGTDAGTGSDGDAGAGGTDAGTGSTSGSGS